MRRPPYSNRSRAIARWLPQTGSRPCVDTRLASFCATIVSVKPRSITGLIGVAAAAGWALHIAAATPIAHAADCPDAEVVFARGTTEDPGVGPTGAAFVDSLRSRVGAKSVGVYAVDYPATTDFPTAVDGITDARTHILATAAACPHTKMVLGGFSQGAAVMGFVTADVVPDGVSASDVPAPMPPDISDHIAAVALFGKPSTRFMHAINDPPVTLGGLYTAKTIDLCVDNDLVCDPHGSSFAAHNTYDESGMVDQGAAFVASRLQASWAADVLAAPALTGPAPGPQPPSAPAIAAAGPSQHLPTAPVTPPGPTTAAGPPPGPAPAPPAGPAT
jgi:cutinase